MKTAYHVVVRDPNWWSQEDGLHCMLRCCEHKHRTREAAERCLEKLVDFNYCTSSSGSWNADWHGSCVEEIRKDGR